ncbi:hypothetical protein [Kingella potus]|uniref:hypothetical protein n=1 Tax=Kingella potus TaxID=265175 RepID=UPI0011C02285|nr:hypothetical protein [Kingella potus]UOP00074.1 hypothetical protein LVJ84_08785 [Kingella potus]
MKNKVLVLNINNTEINYLFDELRKNHLNAIPKFPHITIRGPQKRFNQSTINKVKMITDSISIGVSELDILEFGNIYFCIFKIKAPALKTVWDKPDFPRKKFGFNPHITLYKGDKSTAEKIKYAIETKYKNKFNNLVINSKDIEIRKSIIGQTELSI